MKRNIIILHTDQQRYDSLGCNGNKYARTINIDALAKDGCNFTRHLATNPSCMPSRASLMTGLYVPGHGVSSNGIPLWRRDNGCDDKNSYISKNLLGVDLKEKIPTIADILGDNGYDTALFGKLHLQPHLADKSYNFYESYSHWESDEAVNDNSQFYGFKTKKIILGHGESPCGYNRGHYGRWLLEHYPEIATRIESGEDVNTKEGSIRDDIYQSKLPAKLHNTKWLADEACNYLDSKKSDNDPLFLFVGFPDPHHPFTPPEEVAKEFMNIPIPDFTRKEDLIGDKPIAVKEAIENFKTDTESLELAYKYTTASIHMIDNAVGQITDKLKELDKYDDSIIIYTSDHGDFLGDLDMICKTDLAFNNLLHIPFILKPAKGISLPSVINTPMSNADVLPTILNMIDIKPDSYIQGVDIFSEAGKNNKPLVTSYSAREINRNITLYDETYRYTYYLDTEEEELYNHKNDIKETINLAVKNSKEIREICNNFKVELFKKHIQCDLGIFNHYGLW